MTLVSLSQVFDSSSLNPRAEAAAKKGRGKAKGAPAAEAPVEADLDADAQIRHLHADMPRPNAAEEDRRAEAAAAERHFWGEVQPFPVFFSSGAGVGAQEPSPGGTMLAVSAAAERSLSVFDVRHLPPLLVRKAQPPAVVIALAWSRDSTQLCALDRLGSVSLWSLRLDRKPHGHHLVSSAGVFKTPQLVRTHLLDPLVDLRDSRNRVHPSAAGLGRLIDTSNPRAQLRPSYLAFHPSQTVTGQQPSVLIGTTGGSWFKFNTEGTARVVFAPCCAGNPGGEAEAVAPEMPNVPRRELFVRHLARLLLVQPYGDATRHVTLDAQGYLALWPYTPKAFSQLGWFSPEEFYKVLNLPGPFIPPAKRESEWLLSFQVVVSDVVFSADKEFPVETLFPPTDEERRRELGAPGSKAWDRAADAHRAMLPSMGLEAFPSERRPWSCQPVFDLPPARPHMFLRPLTLQLAISLSIAILELISISSRSRSVFLVKRVCWCTPCTSQGLRNSRAQKGYDRGAPSLSFAVCTQESFG